MSEIVTTGVHRRHDPLGGGWVLVSPHRLDRPWSGERSEPVRDAEPSYEAGCYLCPGNVRANGQRNPQYDGVWSFANDYPALLPDREATPLRHDPLFRHEPACGEARVLCFSPDHSRRLSQMSAAEIGTVITAFAEETDRLGERWTHVQLFENRGAMMGCSNPHPHAQIWASAHVPDIVATEDANQKAYRDTHGHALLLDLVERELADGARVLVENASWAAIVPYWARWPFETLLLPRHPVRQFGEQDRTMRQGLADLLARLLPAFDRLFQTPFPYSMGWHGAPFQPGDHAHWQLHGHIYPPLLRSASVRKFMVGYEMLAEAQRDFTPETAAARIREVL